MAESTMEQDKPVFGIGEGDSRFSISDIDLEVPEDEDISLGPDERNARKNVGIGDIDFAGKASVDGVITEIVYGTLDGEDVCRVRLLLTITSQRRFRIEETTLCCTVRDSSSEALSNLDSTLQSKGDIMLPHVLRVAPKRLNDTNPTAVGISAGWTLQPELGISIGGLSLNLNLGSITRQKTYEQRVGWNVRGRITSQKKGSSNRDRATWTAEANAYQKEGLNQDIEIEMLIGFTKGRPFWLDIVIEARLNLAGMIRFIGQKKRVEAKRHFAPFDMPVVFQGGFV